MDANNSTVMPTTHVSFGITAPELDPEEVTRRLGIQPDRAYLKGSPLSGSRKDVVRKSGKWTIRSKVSYNEDLTTHLESLLELLLPRQREISELSHTATVDFYCSLFDQRGVSLPADLLLKISSLGAELNICIYPADEESAGSSVDL